MKDLKCFFLSIIFNYQFQNQPCPPEALANLLILYCKYEQYDLAHDVLSENEELKMKYLTEVILKFNFYFSIEFKKYNFNLIKTN